jgi:hypothetical protein
MEHEVIAAITAKIASTEEHKLNLRITSFEAKEGETKKELV